VLVPPHYPPFDARRDALVTGLAGVWDNRQQFAAAALGDHVLRLR